MWSKFLVAARMKKYEEGFSDGGERLERYVYKKNWCGIRSFAEEAR